MADFRRSSSNRTICRRPASWETRAGFELGSTSPPTGERCHRLGGFDAVVVMGSPWSVYGPRGRPVDRRPARAPARGRRAGDGVLGVCFGRSRWRRRSAPRCTGGSSSSAGTRSRARTRARPGRSVVHVALGPVRPARPGDRNSRAPRRTDRRRTRSARISACSSIPRPTLGSSRRGSVTTGGPRRGRRGHGGRARRDRDEEPEARRRAYALVDAFLERAGVRSGR